MISLALVLVLAVGLSASSPHACVWVLPIDARDGQSWVSIRLTSIGQFGRPRQARPGVPAHLHTGVDIRRPGDNYEGEPVFPATAGVVISFRDDGPFAQLILEHPGCDAGIVWTVYEHVAEIAVAVGDRVSTDQPVGRFMNRSELDRFGWQFDHLHFEIMRQRPRPVEPMVETPHRLYGTYSLECFTRTDLEEHYYDPETFLKSRW